jgi:hypothetical protein
MLAKQHTSCRAPVYLCTATATPLCKQRLQTSGHWEKRQHLHLQCAAFDALMPKALILALLKVQVCCLRRWSTKLQQNLMELAGQADKSTAGTGQQPAAAGAAAAAAQGVSPQK